MSAPLPRKVLIAVGGLPHSTASLRFGRRIVETIAGRATLLHVVGHHRAQRDTKGTLAAAVEELGGLQIDSRVAVGDPTTEILRETREGGYDLVVVGARERPTFVEQLLGSVSRRIAARAPVSVLVVKRARPTLDRLLICTGGREDADPVIDMGIALAQGAGAAVTILYVVMPPPVILSGLPVVEESVERLLASGTPASRHLRRATERLEASGLQGGLRLRHGAVVDEILREAREGNHDLVLLGAPREQGLLTTYLLGNVVGDVLLQARRPVLVVRRPAATTNDPS